MRVRGEGKWERQWIVVGAVYPQGTTRKKRIIHEYTLLECDEHTDMENAGSALILKFFFMADFGLH